MDGGAGTESDGFPFFECAEVPGDVYFSENEIGTERFEMQTAFAAAAAGLTFFDKLVHDPSVGGWDYNTEKFPKMQGHEPALLVTINDPMCEMNDPHCDEDEDECGPFIPAGRFQPMLRTIEQANAHDYPIPAPASFGANGYLYGRVALCASDGTHIPSTMFHEIGHYIDQNLGDYAGLSGVTNDQLEGGTLAGCCMDSYREGVALAETIGQLVTMYLYRRTYPGIDYTISQAAGPEGSCTLAELDIPGTTIFHKDCVNSGNGGSDEFDLPGSTNSILETFRDDLYHRPQTDADASCAYSTGYKIPSLFQAWWELLFAQQCSGDGDTLSCSDYTGATVAPDYADRYMMALMWALKQGNSVGYVEFWDRMGEYIASEFPGDLALFQHVRDLHDIHVINADGAPVCAPDGGHLE